MYVFGYFKYSSVCRCFGRFEGGVSVGVGVVRFFILCCFICVVDGCEVI